MGTQIRLVGEGFVADCALEGFFTCMSTYVPLQQPWPREALATVMALAPLIMCPDVHAERRHTNIHLVAMWTPPCFLIAKGPMRLSVSGQIGGGRVLFTAIRTLVVLVILGLGRLR